MGRDDATRWQRLTELLAPVHGAALGTARRLARVSDEGDDLLQDAVLRAHARLDTLRDETRFRAWFFAILLSIHRSRSRRSFWRRFLPLGETLAGGAEPATVPPGDDERRRAIRARVALARLPAVQREAIVLHDVEGFPVEEVAAMQGASVPAVKSRLSRGRERLRRYYLRRGLAARDVGRVELARRGGLT
jgi:RNA polymerase sigma-70 factor (ECF subfamily)